MSGSGAGVEARDAARETARKHKKLEYSTEGKCCMQDEVCGTVDMAAVVAVVQSPQIGALMTALAKAQAEMVNPDNDSDNPFFRSRYASMAAVRNATVPVLATHGIAITQHPQFGPGWVRCTTILWCGEEYLKSTLQCPVVKTRRDDRHAPGQIVPVAELNHQDYTATFNYLRRISLQAVCNVSSEDDDDGNQAAGKGMPQPAAMVSTTTKTSTTQAMAMTKPDSPREVLLREIWDLCNDGIVPLRNASMHRAIVFHCFGVDKPSDVNQQPLATLEAGMTLYRHLTAQVITWERQTSPDKWVVDQQRFLAAQSADAVLTDNVDPDTGELRDKPAGWPTAQEQRNLEAQDIAEHLEQAQA